MKARPKSTDINAPKPVHPRAVGHHGLFGATYVRQHMMADESWTPNSLMEEFIGMATLLARRVVCKRLESKQSRKRFHLTNRNLKRQCQNGRTKLQNLLHSDNTKKIRNYLIDHKDMQRLYQKMPVYQVVDNINQRTFVLRKERDRLRFRLGRLKEQYGTLLLERGKIQDRIKYQDEFVLEEEIKSREFMKKIENSNVRLNAIKTINSTYKKMVQVLKQDGIFYEPILRSLDDDIEDQSNFIKHILYLGMPAIAKFKELSEEYRRIEDRVRRTTVAKVQWVADYKKKHAEMKPGPRTTGIVNLTKRYVRETHSMLDLKHQLERVEDTIKRVKFITLCSQAKEIYPRFKSQVDNNMKLNKIIVNDMAGHQDLETKQKRADVLQGVLVHNLSEEEMERLQYIENLKAAIANEDKIEAATLAHIKNRADVYVLLRFNLWNLRDILQYVGAPSKAQPIHYPNSYLKLPLLKFEMLTMHAVPPDFLGENLTIIIGQIKEKVKSIMLAYKRRNRSVTVHPETAEDYHTAYLRSMESDITDADTSVPEEAEDVLQEVKTMQDVPSRKQIKTLSAKLVEELSKKED